MALNNLADISASVHSSEFAVIDDGQGLGWFELKTQQETVLDLCMVSALLYLYLH